MPHGHSRSRAFSAPSFASGRRAIQGAELVAVRIAQIGEIQAANLGATHAGRVPDRFSTIGDPGGMPEIDMVGRLAGKADRATIGMGSRPAIEWLGNDEKTIVGAIDIAPTLTVVVVNTFTMAERAQHSIVEPLCFFQVVGADHNMTEHCLLLP
jgi:hypothetical protein